MQRLHSKELPRCGLQCRAAFPAMFEGDDLGREKLTHPHRHSPEVNGGQVAAPVRLAAKEG